MCNGLKWSVKIENRYEFERYKRMLDLCYMDSGTEL